MKPYEKTYEKGNAVFKTAVCAICDHKITDDNGEVVKLEFGAVVRLGETQPRLPRCKNCGGRVK